MNPNMQGVQEKRFDDAARVGSPKNTQQTVPKMLTPCDMFR